MTETPLFRRTISPARRKERLEDHLELLCCYYNFVRPHRALKFGDEIRTPGIQAGRTTRPLILSEVFPPATFYHRPRLDRILPVITLVRPDDAFGDKAETVGTALPQTEVKIVDPASGKIVAPEVVGEICTRGCLVMDEYFDNPEATATAIDAKGWLHTATSRRWTSAATAGSPDCSRRW